MCNFNINCYVKRGVCLKCGVNTFFRIYQATDEYFTHSVKKTTGLPCLGILKHGNYDLTIRWMYVLSTDTPTIIRAQSKPHTLAVARILSYLDDIGERQRAYAMPSHKRFLGASESQNLRSIEKFYIKKVIAVSTIYTLFRSSIYLYILQFFNIFITIKKDYPYKNSIAKLRDGLLDSSHNTVCFVKNKI